MLVLTLRINQPLKIGDATVRIKRHGRNGFTVAIDAPKCVPVRRDEVNTEPKR